MKEKHWNWRGLCLCACRFVVVSATIMSSYFLAAPAAWDAEFEFKGQKIYYENAEYKEIVDAVTGETLQVLIFRQDGWFKATKKAYGRALVVGGGGAGGYGTTGATNPGGGGGGGTIVERFWKH